MKALLDYMSTVDCETRECVRTSRVRPGTVVSGLRVATDAANKHHKVQTRVETLLGPGRRSEAIRDAGRKSRFVQGQDSLSGQVRLDVPQKLSPAPKRISWHSSVVSRLA